MSGQKITTILFDCDNTLVLSEELAFEGCADLINKILASQQAIDTYNAKYKPSPVPPPPEPAQASQPAPAESVCSPSLSISNALMPF